MGDQLTQTLKVPKNVVIPAPWLIGMVVVGLINAGVVWREFQDLKEWQKTSATTIAEIKERQISNIAAVQNLNVTASNHEGRITRLESQMLDARATPARR